MLNSRTSRLSSRRRLVRVLAASLRDGPQRSPGEMSRKPDHPRPFLRYFFADPGPAEGRPSEQPQSASNLRLICGCLVLTLDIVAQRFARAAECQIVPGNLVDAEL